MARILWWALVPLAISFSVFVLVRLPSPSSVRLEKQGFGAVEIVRDEFGIPHVIADSLEDAAFALGYAMCQDRMLQIDLMRRAATGRLSEIFGGSTLETDLFIRNIKIRQQAELDIQNLDPLTRKLASNFAQGINEAAKDSWLPLEYYLLNYHWDTFTPEDSQSILYLTSLVLSMSWGTDVLRTQLQAHLGEYTNILIPNTIDLISPKAFIVSNEELPEHLKGPKEVLFKSEAKVSPFLTEFFDQGSGSNSWIISGKHTKSGKPLMANDPHLGVSIPNVWYLNHLNVSGQSVFGVNSVGYPTSAIGRSSKFIWGITSLKVDDIDIYAEKLVNSTHYLFGDQVLPLKTFTEIIKVSGQKPAVLNIRETVHGPILENTIKAARKFSNSLPEVHSGNLSFAWSVYGVRDNSMSFIHKAFSIKDIGEFRKYAGHTTAIKLAVIVGSSTGDILYQSVGRSPIRAAYGNSILQGWDANTIWRGYIPYEEMPYVLNPPKGFIVTANNYIAGTDYKYFESFGSNVCQGRAERITELIQHQIEHNHKFVPEDMIEMQQDELDIFARESVPVLLSKLNTANLKEKRALADWDFVMARDSFPAALYTVWIRKIAANLVREKIPEALKEPFIRTLAMQLALKNYFLPGYPSLEQLCDSNKTQGVETCSDVISEAFDQAVDIVGGRTYGGLHKVTLKHMPFSQSKVLGWAFERSVDVGGSGNTVHATSSNWFVGLGTTHGPTVKFISDLGNSTGNFWALEGGISGNFMGRHYADMLPEYHYGSLINFSID